MHDSWVLRGSAIVCAFCVTTAAQAEEEAADAPPAKAEAGSMPEEELLDRLLQDAASDTQGFRMVSGVLGSASGVSLLSLGVVRFVRDPGGNQIERGVALMWLGTGTVGLVTGLVLLTRKSPEERVLERWRARLALDAPLSEYELGSFAGELRAAAAFRERERKLVRWTSLAGAGAGVLSLALIPAANNLTDASRRNILIIGSIFSAVGLMNFGFSFRKSGPERAWDAYERSVLSTRRKMSITVAPTFSRAGGGFSLVGSF